MGSYLYARTVLLSPAQNTGHLVITVYKHRRTKQKCTCKTCINVSTSQKSLLLAVVITHAFSPDTPMANTPTNDTPQEENPPLKFCGRKGRSGAPKGNDNAARHYLRAGKLPANLQYVEHRINSFRRHLEEEVTSKKGSVGIVDAAAINSACKWERHGLLAQHWLRHEAEKLNASDRLKFSEAIAKASDNRDKNLRMLGLDAAPPAPWMIDGKTGEPINDDGKQNE